MSILLYIYPTTLGTYMVGMDKDLGNFGKNAAAACIVGTRPGMG